MIIDPKRVSIIIDQDAKCPWYSDIADGIDARSPIGIPIVKIIIMERGSMKIGTLLTQVNTCPTILLGQVARPNQKPVQLPIPNKAPTAIVPQS